MEVSPERARLPSRSPSNPERAPGRPPRVRRWRCASPRLCAPLWVGAGGRILLSAPAPLRVRGIVLCSPARSICQGPASDKQLSLQTCIVTNPNKSQSLFLSASAGSQALMALPFRPPEETGRGLCAHLSAPGPPGSLSFPSCDMGPMRAVAAEPQRSGTVFPLGIPGQKATVAPLLVLVDLSGILLPWPGLKIPWDLLYSPPFYRFLRCSKPQKFEIPSTSHLKLLSQSIQILPLSSEIFKTLIPKRPAPSPPLPSVPSGIPLDACSKYLLAPEEIHL